jgi:glutathione S-transferase
MILYGLPTSPFARKVMAFASQKGIALESCAQKLDWPSGAFDPAFLACSPFKKVPALRDGEFFVADSSAIITYLDALHPLPNLIPLDPRDRARVIWFEEYADTMLAPTVSKIFANRVFYKRFLGREGDDAAAAKAEREELPPMLDYLEGVLPPRGFLVDQRLTLADIAVVSSLANLRHHEFPLHSWPRVAAYSKSLLAQPCFSGGIAKERAMVAA